MSLGKQYCMPCEGGIEPLALAQAKKLQEQVPTWEIIEEYPYKLKKEFSFKNFAEALAFTNKVGEIAEAQGHHPDIFISWNKVILTLYTHAIQGLSLNDFIVAAHVDNLSYSKQI